MLSKTLRNAVRTSGVRQWRLAAAIGIHPTALSNWLAGRYEPRRGDRRVLQLASLVGVPESEAFAVQQTNTREASRGGPDA